MIIPIGALQRTSPEKASKETYDVVIIGSGISGSILANELGAKGKSVLVLEAGLMTGSTLDGYSEYLTRYYATAYKDNQSPYPINNDVPMPHSTDARKITPGIPETSGYLVQNGPFGTDTTYTRVFGGTSMHWEAKTPRMLPHDFLMQDTYGVGLNWPIEYDSMQQYYEKAEGELGVSSDVDVQEAANVDLKYRNGYEYPMHSMPFSYLDTVVDRGLRGTSVDLFGQSFDLSVRSFPQARNGVPNAAYNKGAGFIPVGAVDTVQSEMGGRCQGNNNCVPICPVQAKYHAGKTMAKALQNPNVHLLYQCVVSRIVVHENAGRRVKHIEVKHYHSPSSTNVTSFNVTAKVYILCTNAIENARLMLASGLQAGNGLVGRNLMDHGYLLTWALMPEDCGTMRGTNCTGGIVALRNGKFRAHQAAFAADIHNDGWGWSSGSPLYDLRLVVDQQYLFGTELRKELVRRITRQLLLAFMLDVPPDENNRVSVDSRYRDALGHMRPVISYAPPGYTMRGAAYAREFSRIVFQRLGADDHTNYDPGDYGYVSYEGNGYVIRGGNHLAGTHIMGDDPARSVVNTDQRSWEHDNLFLLGGGSMPTIGTSNISLTIAALCFRSSEAVLAQI
jgi:choline dehydrogenase-like flavoprotein